MFTDNSYSTGTPPMRLSPYEHETTDLFPGSYGTGFNKFNYCDHCGCYHQGICSRIKAIEYYPNGMIKRVEYHSSSYSVNINLM